MPIIVSGIAQDVRYPLLIQTITTTGSGGSTITAQPQDPHNTTPATTTCNSLVTSAGNPGVVISALYPSILVPHECIVTPAQRIPISGGGRLAVSLPTGLGAYYTMSSEILFEEF